ncbi:hypothetical protein Tco_1157448 [Tanacetum coccineum]
MGTTRLRRDRRVLVVIAGLPSLGCPCESPLAPPTKGVGLRVADSLTGNHPEDDFTPLETIRRSHSIIGKRIPLELEGETFEPKRMVRKRIIVFLFTMSAKDSIAIQTCELSEEEFNEFLALYPIPSSYHVILPKSNQTVLDAPLGYVGLYTHSFSIANLRLPVTKFFCEVLEYFQVLISRLNPFGCAKLTTFVVMPEKHISHLFPKVITRIEGWKERFFYVQNSIVPAKYLQLLLEQNKYDSKSYKDKLPLDIEQNPMFQRLGRYSTSVLEYFQVHISRLNPFGCAKLTTFVVMCKAYGCKPTIKLFRGFFNLCRAGKWLTFAKKPEKHISHLFPKVITQMAFRNFVYAEDEEDLSFLPKETSPAFGTGSPSVSVNIEPIMTDEEPVLQPAEAMADSGGSPKHELFVVHPGSVVAHMKNRKCKTRGRSSRPHVKRKLAPGSSTDYATRAKTSASKDDVSFLTISDEDEGLSDVPELKDATACHLKISSITPLAWKNHLDNHLDLELSCELLEVIEKLRGECDVIKERERAREEESEGLRAKCEAAMMMLESQKWAGYQDSLSSLESQVVSLEAEKARLEAIEVSLRKKVDDVRRDMMEAFEQVAAMKEPFDLTKVKGYHPSAPIEVLLSKKPSSIQRPAPSKTQALVASSKKATPSFVRASNTMSPLADTTVVKPLSFQVE